MRRYRSKYRSLRPLPYTPYMPIPELAEAEGETKAGFSQEFASWGAYLAHVEQAPLYPDPSSRRLGDHYSNHSWALGASWTTAVKLAREGWPEGTARVKAMSTSLTEQIASTIERYDPYYDLEAGGQLDVARYLEGEPECWIRHKEITMEGPGIKLLTLVFNSTTSASVSAETMLSKGAAAVSAIQCLEYAGHRVKVYMAVCYATRHKEGEKGPAQCRVLLKDFHESLDIDRLTFALAHPASFRRLNFSWAEHLPGGYNRSHGDLYGYPIAVSKDWQGDIYIGHSLGSEAQWRGPASAKEWVIEQLKAQGVPLKQEDK